MDGPLRKIFLNPPTPSKTLIAIKMHSPLFKFLHENILLIVAGVALGLVQVMQLFKLTGAIVGAQFIIKFLLTELEKSSQIFKISFFWVICLRKHLP